MSDELADAIQPEGQGGEGVSDAPYAEYLNRIPEQVRGDVEPIFKEWDANTTRRFQEHSEFRKQWEPFDQTGIRDIGPEAAQWATTFYQSLNNPEAIKGWYEDYAKQNGLLDESPEPEPDFGEFGLEDQSQAFQKMLDKALGPISQQLQGFQQWQQMLEQGAREAQLKEMFDRQVAELKAKHADRFDEKGKTEEALAVIAEAYKDDPQNAISKAWATLEQILNTNETQVLQRKVQLPGGGAELGGVPDANPPEYKTLAEAGAAAREMIRNLNRP